MKQRLHGANTEIATLVEMLRLRAQQRPERLAYRFLMDDKGEEVCWTYADIDLRARAIAARLEQKDARGERILLLYPPGLDYIAAFFGCLYAGAVAVPAYPPRANKPMPRVQAIVADCQAHVVLTTSSVLADSRRRIEQAPDLAALEWISTDDLPLDLANAWRPPDTNDASLAFLQYTSGSTGDPKGVMVTHGNLLHNLEMIFRGFRIDPNGMGITWLPMYHDMGLIGGILGPMFAGGPATLMSPVAFLQRPASWLQAITRFHGTISGAPNFAYELCVEKVSEELLDSLDLSTWQTAFTGAEPIRAETLERFANKFARCGFKRDVFYPCFGLAEGTLIATGGDGPSVPVTHTIRRAALEQNRVEAAQPGDSGSQTLVGCGAALMEQRVLIVNPETLSPCGEDTVGEIWCQGPSMAQGYWNRPEESQHTFAAHLAKGDGPFMRTGDLGYMHAGQLYVTGRLKDLIIIRGRNHYPQDIERTVEQSHAALRADGGAAFSIDVNGEERLVLVQEVQREHRHPNVEEIVTAIRAAVARQHDLQVHAIALVKTMTIPKTSSGKIKRRETRSEFLAGNLSLVGQWNSTDSPTPVSRVARDALPTTAPKFTTSSPAKSAETITAWLVTEIAKRLNLAEREIDITAPFDRYGLDSLAAVTLSGDLEQWLGRELSPTLVYEYATIEALARYLAADVQTADAAPIRRQSNDEPIAIIGLSCRFPGGANGPESFWRLLHEGVDCVGEVPPDRWDAAAFYDPNPAAPGKMITKWGGFLQGVDRFDPQFFGIAPREAVSMDPQQRLFLECCWEAMENANQRIDRLAGSQTGVFMGICNNDYSHLLHESGDRTRIDAYTGTGNTFSVASGRVSYVLGLHGPNFPIDTACSSSLVAVHLAMQSLRAGECRAALAGGVNLLLSPDSMIYFSKVQAMSPDGRCMTFDARANGYVRGEGCGVVALKCLSDAVADGDRVLAVIRGSAVNHDGRSNGLTAPNGAAQEAVLRRALAAANVEAKDVQYLEAHGTGTSLGDPIEVRAVGNVLSKGRAGDEPLVLGSVKTNIGHLEAAAGVAGLIKVVLSLMHEEIPPHLHFQKLNPHIPRDLVRLEIPTKARPWKRGDKRRIAGISSFGFSGTNAHLIIEEGPAETAVVNQPERPLHLVTLSAKTPEALSQLAARYAELDLPVADVGFTANTGRAQFAERAAVVADSSAQMRQRMQALAEGQDTAGVIRGQAQQRGARPKVAMLFTGQGAQYAGMGRRLYETQPTFQKAIDQCAKLLAPHLERPLVEVLYPSAGAASPIDETAYTQPCLFAFEYALAQLWRSWGVEPSLVLGHSVGEYVAACLAGVLSLEDALKLIAARGRLMQALPTGGQMAAVFATPQQVEAAIGAYADRVSIAAYNGPRNVVISGDGAAIQKILAELEQEGVQATRLSVSHAFHSPLMAPMLEEFQRVAGEIVYQSPKLRMISNLTGQLASGDDLASAAYWREHVRRPVQFARSIETLSQQGIDLWLEIGPSPTLLGMARRVGTPADQIKYLPSLRQGRDDWQTLLESLSVLYVAGIEIDGSGFDRDYQRRKAWLPTYPFQRQRYWLGTTPAARSSSQPAQVTQAGHPLLGAKLRSAGRETIFEVELNTARLPYLADHRVYDHVILPAAAYLEMAVAAAARVFHSEHVVLEKVRISEPLFVAEEPRTVQVIVSPGEPSSFTIASLKQVGGEDAWTVHATGQCRAAAAAAEVQEDVTPTAEMTALSKSAYYQRLHEQGLQYGPRFQGIAGLSRRDGEAWGQLQLAAEGDGAYRLHPALLDACFQLMGAAATEGMLDQTAYVPVGLERLELFVERLPDQEPLVCRAMTRGEQRAKAALFSGDVRLLDQQGRLLASITGLTLARAPRELLLKDAPAAGGGATGEDWLYELTWQEAARDASSSNGNAAAGPWLINPDAGGVGAALAQQLELRGEHVALAEQSGDIVRLLKEISPRGVVYLRGLDQPPLSTDGEPRYADLAAAQEHSLGGLLHLVQALAGAQLATRPRLWLATRGAVSIGDSDGASFNISSSSLWGLARVVALEQADLRPVRIDLDPADAAESVAALLAEIDHPDREDQLAYRQGTRYAARLIHQRAPHPLAVSQSASADVRLEIPQRGVLDNLALRPLVRRPPGRGEVEIAVRATGLNFRDVLNVLGLYPGDPGPLGGECSGVIAAIGEGVSELAVGDEVLGIASGSFATYVTTPAALVVKKPANLSFSAAATIPITFLTAHYALHELAGIKRGDRVLIQAAAGGVGLAAVQLARHAGAEIFGTAGSPAKRQYLMEQGVAESHLFHSRNVEFAAGIEQQTQGQGVRIVLNSLAGEFIPKGLSLVAPGGHFLEIGKADLWSQERVAAVNPRARYTTIALDQMVVEDPARVGRLLRELMPRFESGELKPLKHEEFPLEDAAGAFRYMAQAKHIGKVVVTLSRVARDARSQPAIHIHATASYLITGGLGALGLKTAAWLIEQGAKHLILAGRSAPNEAAQRTIGEFQQRGVRVHVAQADLSRADEVQRVLQEAQQNLPPLKGIIHAAGVLDDGVLVNLDWPRFERVLAPKLAAGWHLHRQTKDLDFFVMYSSMASLLGSPGQGNYAAANAFLDGLAWHRHARGLPALSINWGPWSDSGMAATRNEADQRRWAAQGITPIPTATGFKLLDQLLLAHAPQAAVLPIDWERWVAAYPQTVELPLFGTVVAGITTKGERGIDRPAILAVPPSGRCERLEQYLTEQVARVLRISAKELHVQAPLKTVGLDSLMAIELKNLVEQNLAVEIPAAKLLEGPSIAQLAELLAPEFGASDSAAATTAGDPASGTPWIAHREPQVDPRLRLFCFHFLGGGASAFGDWQEALGSEIEVCAVQLPGREERLQEQASENMDQLVATLARELLPLMDRPFALYGHSMGALIAFALARHLRREQHQLPVHFFAAGYFAPHAPSPFLTRDDLHAAGLSTAVRRMIDAPEAVLNNAEFMQALLPTIQADSRLVGSYVHSEEEPLECPLTALGGLRDEEVSQNDLAAWERHTAAAFQLEMFPGKHLFLLGDRDAVLKLIQEHLRAALGRELPQSVP